MSDETTSKSKSHLRVHFLTGLAVGAPVVLTLWLIWSAIMMIDGWVLPLLPKGLVPVDSLMRIIPGFGVLAFFVATIILGILAKGLLGRTFMRIGEATVSRIPLVRTVYSSIKQIVDTVVGQDGPKFERACLVQYPRPGMWAVAFISTKAKGEIDAKLNDGETMLSLFMPTTPNPTSGFLLFVKQSDVVMLDMGVDDAVKLVISAGLVYPSPPKDNKKK
jgi:uncharacterized membrane protein